MNLVRFNRVATASPAPPPPPPPPSRDQKPQNKTAKTYIRMKRPNKSARILHDLSLPVSRVVEIIHVRLGVRGCRKVTHVILGTTIMFAGAHIAHCAEHSTCPIIIDTVGYGIHGLGLAPLAKILAEVLGVEI